MDAGIAASAEGTAAFAVSIAASRRSRSAIRSFMTMAFVRTGSETEPPPTAELMSSCVALVFWTYPAGASEEPAGSAVKRASCSMKRAP